MRKRSCWGESMDRFGDLSGIVYNVETGMLVSGHQRAELLGSSQVTVLNDYEEPTEVGTLALGYIENADGEKFPYREVLWDRKTEAEAMIAANKIGGEFDNESLNKFFDEMGSDIEISHTGFDENILRGKFDESILKNDDDEFSFHNTVSGMDASSGERVSENNNMESEIDLFQSDDSKQIIKDSRMRKESENKNLNSFPYYGSKFPHLDFILPNLPTTKMFIDVFGGSASVILNKKQTNHNIYNDLDSKVCTFFRQLRDNSDELIRLLKLTLYSREEFEKTFDDGKFNELEIARKFFVQNTMGWENSPKKYNGPWKAPNINKKNNGLCYLDKVDNLELLIEKLKTIVIENVSAIETIKRYDNKETLFYIDPPILMSEKLDKDQIYDFEMTSQEHINLIKLLKNIEGKAVISGYDSKLYNDLDDWFKIKNKFTQIPINRQLGISKNKIETLWLNFDPETQEYDE